MKNPKRLPAIVYIDVEVSYRWRGGGPACAYLCVVEQRNETHRRIVHTEHIGGSGEQLIDTVIERSRQLHLEFVLPNVEPF